MATSGTYTFSMTRDKIIQAALRKTTRFGVGDAIAAEDTDICAEALNLLCKRLALSGLFLWCIQSYAVPLLAGQATYNLSVATGMSRPLRILDAFLRDSTGNDVQISLVASSDYDTLGQKDSPGRANQGYYDPQLGAATITLYNVPADSDTTLYVRLQRQVQDINLSLETPDFPQEAYEMLVWNLADSIALDYATPSLVRGEIALKAKMLLLDFTASEQEQVSVTLVPNMRGLYG